MLRQFQLNQAKSLDNDHGLKIVVFESILVTHYPMPLPKYDQCFVIVLPKDCSTRRSTEYSREYGVSVLVWVPTTNWVSKYLRQNQHDGSSGRVRGGRQRLLGPTATASARTDFDTCPTWAELAGTPYYDVGSVVPWRPSSFWRIDTPIPGMVMVDADHLLSCALSFSAQNQGRWPCSEWAAARETG